MSRRGFLATRDPDLVEEMDRPDCDPGTLTRTYAQFGVVNAVVSGWRRTYTTLLRPAFSPDRPNTLLDIGSGGGDVPRALARWAQLDGLALEVTAIDPDERAYTYATSRPALPGLTFRRALSSELVAQGAVFDAVVSNHVLHHLDSGEFAGLLDDSEQLTRRVAVHSDIARHPVGYALFSAGTLPLPGSYIRRDGLTSIRRSYTPDELRAAVAGRPDWQVRTAVPFINQLVLDRRDAHGDAGHA
ncbi:class I SAM-dependent methyltransferase [Arthrobacter agilis]|uniref:class I SAM-dependent methyltransferase n=1 Tax=Arthrobacter agilis TaxID=37921 RepID=UPI00278ACA0F|nr:class I SAM-dependent methyltransferase [Arthrobacter agilis]MDQ0733627.1 2-polyprenyl-3-methyl-5-hydroxy-6-metoxy-1,4-benzoquinol methylase [Arthrobacter agilis]